MIFLKNLRTAVGNYFLHKEVTKKNYERTILNIKEASTVGIVFSSTTAEEVDLVKKYSSYLKEMEKKVKVLGYISAKQTDDNTSWWPDQSYITRKKINWFFKPENDFIHSFVEEGFDMLIDLNVQGELPLLFVTAAAKARCKVGRYSEEHKDLYDVMIETDETKSLKYFLRNVDTYMYSLGKDKNVQTINY